MSEKRQIIAWLLGNYLDGWADLIEGMGSRAESVKEAMVKQLVDRGMPDVEVEDVTIKEGFFSGLHRSYTITKTSPGAHTTIFVEQHGKDLYASWRSFIRPAINWILLFNFFLIAVALSIIYAILINILGYYNVYSLVISTWDWNTFGNTFLYWVLYAGLILIGEIFILGFYGVLKKMAFLTYITGKSAGYMMLIALGIALFIQGPGEAMGLDLVKFFSAINQGMDSYMVSFAKILGIALSTFGGIIILAMFFGLILRTNLLAFILKQPSLFDAEDITAMNLSVHKSLLRALDQAGIDSSKLRLKAEFKGGRRHENV